MKKRTFSIYTLGCKLNYSESSDIARRLCEAGFIQNENPDIFIVNSCAVTAVAVKKSRNLVSRIHREHPESQIIVIGCYAALQPVILQEWPGVNAVFGSEDKANVIPYLSGEPLPEKTGFTSSFSSGERTRSFLKIQDGCDYHCTYCTVASARGKSRSDSAEHVLGQMEKIAQLGIKEIILTGVNTGDFGRQNGENLFSLLRSIDRQKAVPRVRISSIEPNLLKDEIIDLAAQSSIIMPHFHIPLQSGSDKILSAMKRRYSRDFFREKIEKIKSSIPDAYIAIDIISGFPGETDEDFEDSLRFIDSLPVSDLHVFTYSRRDGTPAAEMPQVKESVKKQRTQHLLRLSEEKRNAFYKQYIGRKRPVLFESDSSAGMMNGFTDNYIRIRVPFREENINRIEDILLTEDLFAPEK